MTYVVILESRLQTLVIPLHVETLLSFLYHDLSPFTCLCLSSCIPLMLYLSLRATHAMPTTCFLSSSFSFILYPLSAFHFCVVTSPTTTQLYSMKVASPSLRFIRPWLAYKERFSHPTTPFAAQRCAPSHSFITSSLSFILLLNVFQCIYLPVQPHGDSYIVPGMNLLGCLNFVKVHRNASRWLDTCPCGFSHPSG